MNVTITDIDQRYSLGDGGITSYLILQLPSGGLIRAMVDEETAASVIREATGAPHVVEVADVASTPMVNRVRMDPVQIQEAMSPQRTQVPPAEPPPTHHVSSGIVEWEKLPDTQLPPVMKTILRTSGVDPFISIEDLDRLKLEMGRQLSQRPRAGQVAFNTGNQRAIEAAPRRTVPMDSYGNPQPPGGIVDPDPGEGQDDEDGVQQV